MWYTVRARPRNFRDSGVAGISKFQEYDPELKEKSTRLIGMDVDTADPYTMLWEERVINSLLHIAQEFELDGYKLLPNIARR